MSPERPNREKEERGGGVKERRAGNLQISKVTLLKLTAKNPITL